jgi:hypothetical protein
MISGLISGSIRGYVFENPVEVYPLIGTDHEFHMRNKRVVGGIAAGGFRGRFQGDFKAAAIAAGVNVAEFETTGEPTDRLDIRMRGPAHPSQSGG